MTVDNNSKNMNKSVTITMKLLQFLSETKGLMRLNDIAEAIGFPQTTVLRYINSLIYEGYVFRENNTGCYALTRKICEIGEQFKSNMSLRAISNDIIFDLSNNLDHGLALVIEHDRECVYLDCIYDPNNLGITLMHIGKKSPMHATGSGKIFLNSLSDSELDNYIEEKGLPKLTEYTIVEKDKLIDELSSINEKGYSLDNEECEVGLRCVSVPIYSYADKPAAALSSFSSTEKFTDELIKETVIPQLKQAAREISFRLGHH